MRISETVHINGREIDTVGLRAAMRWSSDETDEEFAFRIRLLVRLIGVGFAFTQMPDGDGHWSEWELMEPVGGGIQHQTRRWIPD